MEYHIGQRWISEMEPELGLGIVKNMDRWTLTLTFPASECERQYALASAPLKRVEFKAGDTVQSRDGIRFLITSVSEADGLIVYRGENRTFSETELSDSMSFTTPHERLLSGFIDRNRDFNLRYQSLLFRYRARQSAVRGFVGGRIDLIPHQLYVAHQVASMPIPRVLLSDETGLGKTIESCLILHRLLISERINRVLIIVPNSLVHQWFIELIRRFNLVFRIYDSDYCESVQTDVNPFLEDALGICSIDFLAGHEKWRRQAIIAGWDMVVIDEAHHLTEGSAEYHLAEALSAASKGLMLLTATPEQLGHRSHFSRLRLLDPARYHDYAVYQREEKEYQKITQLVDKLLTNTRLSPGERERLGALISSTDPDTQPEQDMSRLIDNISDQHGPGRAVFRNTRESVTGFPKRLAHLIPLAGNIEDLKNQTIEFENDLREDHLPFTYPYKDDPRIIWLAHFLKKYRHKKVLLLCRSIDKVKAIDDALRHRMKIHSALFHEQLTLLQRDRNASWFAQQDGAQILICSEIGSEGRNFQFAHDLVLFDLPLNPELLEQRIGRLDRIGQKQTIEIHVPFISGSEYEILTRWYHEGLHAFEANVTGSYQIYQKLGNELKRMTSKKQFSTLDEFLEKTRALSIDIAEKLKKGRDRLLELNSFRPGIAEGLIHDIKTMDDERFLEKFMLRIFHFYDIQEDEIFNRTYRLNIAALSNPEFPLPRFKEDEVMVTFDRKTALSHEDIEFLTWDHPMVLGAMEIILGSEHGNCAMAIWPDGKHRELLLEAIYVLECVAPRNLRIDRFLPPTPIRILVNHSYKNCTEKYSDNLLAKRLKNSPDKTLLENQQVRTELLHGMLTKCQSWAEQKASEISNLGVRSMETALTHEVNRLMELKKVNVNIRGEEISLIRREIESIRKAIQTARIRLDSIRLINRY